MNTGTAFFFAMLFLIGSVGTLVCAALWLSGTWARIEESDERARLDSMPKDLTSCPNCYELHDRGSFFCSVKCVHEFFKPRHEPLFEGGAGSPLPAADGSTESRPTLTNHTLTHGGEIQSRAAMPSPGASYPAAAMPATAVGESSSNSTWSLPANQAVAGRGSKWWPAKGRNF